jgi:hypothetical protein
VAVDILIESSEAHNLNLQGQGLVGTWSTRVSATVRETRRHVTAQHEDVVRTLHLSD